MIVVDSSVWIDTLNGRKTIQTHLLEAMVIAGLTIAAGDLILVEVLQGTRGDRGYRSAQSLFDAFQPLQISDHHVAIQAARNYRLLRTRGITIRKTIDTLIATRCIIDRLPLLYSGRDFDPFVEHLGLIPALVADTGVN